MIERIPRAVRYATAALTALALGAVLVSLAVLMIRFRGRGFSEVRDEPHVWVSVHDDAVNIALLGAVLWAAVTAHPAKPVIRRVAQFAGAGVGIATSLLALSGTSVMGLFLIAGLLWIIGDWSRIRTGQLRWSVLVTVSSCLVASYFWLFLPWQNVALRSVMTGEG